MGFNSVFKGLKLGEEYKLRTALHYAFFSIPLLLPLQRIKTTFSTFSSTTLSLYSSPNTTDKYQPTQQVKWISEQSWCFHMSYGKTQHSDLNGNKHSPLEFFLNTILTFQCRLEISEICHTSLACVLWTSFILNKLFPNRETNISPDRNEEESVAVTSILTFRNSMKAGRYGT